MGVIMKEKCKKLAVCFLALVLAAAEVSFISGLGICATVEAAPAKISQKNLKLMVKESAILKISGTKKSVTWSSSNNKVATVSKGKVIAKRKGTATITAKVGSSSYRCKVKVVTPGDLYRTLLEKRSYAQSGGYNFKINYFYLIDINRDQVPEMVCMDQWYNNSLYVFTIKKGKVVFLGSSGSHTGYRETPKLYYSKKYKSLCCIEKNATFGGGLTGPSYDYYRISGSKIINWKHTAEMELDGHTYYYEIGAKSKNKFVSKSKQKAFYKKYFAPKYIKSYKLLENTSSARNSI